MEITYNGHRIRGTYDIPGTDKMASPYFHTFVDGRLTFPKKNCNSEQQAIDYAIEYGKWIVDHPTSERGGR